MTLEECIRVYVFILCLFYIGSFGWALFTRINELQSAFHFINLIICLAYLIYLMVKEY